MRQDFGHWALVTGAGQRIGRVIALALAKAGYDIALHCNASREKAEAVAQEIRAQGREAKLFSCNLEDSVATSALISTVIAEVGTLQVLVNNASVFLKDELLDGHAGGDTLALPLTPNWQRNFAVNLQAPIILTEAFAKQFLAAHPARDKHPRGGIINMLDQRVLKLNPLFFSYTLSKTALWTATRTLAQSLAPLIRVNGVGPGPTLANSVEREAAFVREAQSVLLGEAVNPQAVADAVVYLCGAESVTGQMLAVDNGQHLVWQTPDLTV